MFRLYYTVLQLEVLLLHKSGDLVRSEDLKISVTSTSYLLSTCCQIHRNVSFLTFQKFSGQM